MDLNLRNTYFKLLNKKNNFNDFQKFISDKPISYLNGKSFDPLIPPFNPFVILIKKNQLEKFKLLLDKFPIEYFEPQTIINNYPNTVGEILNHIINNVIANNHVFERIFRECCFQLERKKSQFLDELINKINRDGFNYYEIFYKKIVDFIFYKSEDKNLLEKVIYNPYYNLIDYIKITSILLNIIIIKSSCSNSIEYFISIKKLLNKLDISNEDILINWVWTRNSKNYKFKRGSITQTNLLNNLLPLNPNYKSKIFIADLEIKLSSILIFLGKTNILKEISVGKTLENIDDDMIALIKNNLTNGLNEFINNNFSNFISLYHKNMLENTDEKLIKFLNKNKYFGKVFKEFLIEQINKIEKNDYTNAILNVL